LPGLGGSATDRLTRGLLGIDFLRFFVINTTFSIQDPKAILAVVNPFSSADHGIATWFHERLTPAFVTVLHAFTEFGSSEWIGIVLFALMLFFAWKRWWPSIVMLVIAVPGGMLLNEWLKVLVHRHRPFVDGPFVDWSGYSFASGHTIGATLLYGQLLLFALPALKTRHWRMLTVACASLLILLVGFSRIALGAHFLTDVLGAIFFGVMWLALCLVAGRFVGRIRMSPKTILPVSSVSEVVPLPVEPTAQLVPVAKTN
jgi:membrane-associated phospholipid phosphatase